MAGISMRVGFVGYGYWVLPAHDLARKPFTVAKDLGSARIADRCNDRRNRIADDSAENSRGAGA